MERRQTSWIRLAWRHYLWVPLLPVVTAVVLLLVGQSLSHNAALLDLHGADTIATVTDREIVERRDSDGHRSTDYRLRIAFTASNGVRVTDWDSVSRETYDSVQAGDTMPVRYVAHDPAIFEVEPGRTAFSARMFSGFGIVILGIAVAIGAFLGRHIPSKRRAAARGAVREARVTEHLRSNVRVNGRARWRLSWTDAVGETGRSDLHRQDDLPSVGSVIVVYLDPRGGRGWWENDL
ncbi:MAG: DUF3592 domain-containing protein [Rhodobacter sp.]|nr:DUF3592 domain-containing protein [Paracoccaceae bacterium]MCC0077785.1 DUF3592 domain-containing protein [Rhodobacter sp.]